LPQVRKGDALSLRKLINYVTNNLNALKALELKVPVQDNAESFNVSYNGSGDAKRMGVNYSATWRHPIDHRTGYLSGIKMPSFGATADNPASQGAAHHIMRITFNKN